MADNIRKIGGPDMLRLVVDDETDVNPTDPDPRSMADKDRALDTDANELRSGGQRRKRNSLRPEAVEVAADLSVEEAAAGDDGPVDDASDAADSSDAGDTQLDLNLLEALLFGTQHPLTPGRLAELLELPTSGPVRKAIKTLNAAYEQTERSFRIEQVAGGYQMLSLPEFGDALKKLHQKETDSKLTKAALETLAIVAYKQPILRAEVEAIRGVQCGETIRSLMEKHLVRIAGRAEEPGRPILYGTTKRFLELFGLNSLKDLPQNEELTPRPE